MADFRFQQYGLGYFPTYDFDDIREVTKFLQLKASIKRQERAIRQSLNEKLYPEGREKYYGDFSEKYGLSPEESWRRLYEENKLSAIEKWNKREGQANG
jgi:hypothetical protein